MGGGSKSSPFLNCGKQRSCDQNNGVYNIRIYTVHMNNPEIYKITNYYGDEWY